MKMEKKENNRTMHDHILETTPKRYSVKHYYNQERLDKGLIHYCNIKCKVELIIND